MSQYEESESDYDSVSDDEIVQTDENLLSPTQDVPRNHVLELVRHSNRLQTLLRKSSLELRIDHNLVAKFYCRLKESCKTLKKAYDDSQRTVTNLKVENWNLTRELSERNMERLTITPGNEESNPHGNYQADFEDTVNSLNRQLKICEREKRQDSQTYGAKIQELEQCNAQLQNTLNAKEAEYHNYVLQLRKEQENLNHQIQADHQVKTELEGKIATLQERTATLLQDVTEQKELLKSKEESIEVLQSLSKEDEMENANLKRDLEAKDRSLCEKSRHLESLQVKLDNADEVRKEKERSLDQMVDQYNVLLSELRGKRVESDQNLARYLSVEESLRRKSEEAIELSSRLRDCEHDCNLHKERASIFESDFKLEREARQALHQKYDMKFKECEHLNARIRQYETERETMIRDMQRLQERQLVAAGMRPS